MSKNIGKLVVLSSRWNIHSNRVGVIVGNHLKQDNVFLVLWSDENGIKLSYHLLEALLSVTNQNLKKIKERICNIK